MSIVNKKYFDIPIYILSGFSAAFITSYFLLRIRIESGTIFYFLVWIINAAIFYNLLILFFALILGKGKEIYLRKKGQLLYLISSIKRIRQFFNERKAG